MKRNTKQLKKKPLHLQESCIIKTGCLNQSSLITNTVTASLTCCSLIYFFTFGKNLSSLFILKNCAWTWWAYDCFNGCSWSWPLRLGYSRLWEFCFNYEKTLGALPAGGDTRVIQTTVLACPVSQPSQTAWGIGVRAPSCRRVLQAPLF